jgi:hypothetical protein
MYQIPVISGKECYPAEHSSRFIAIFSPVFISQRAMMGSPIPQQANFSSFGKLRTRSLVE